MQRSAFLRSLVIAITFSLPARAQKQNDGDAILGTWKANEKVLAIEIYKTGNTYNGKIISFTDHHSSIPAEERLDDKNPDPSLRSRKMIGMNVLTSLTYQAEDKNWVNGEIYDAGSGNSYSVKAELGADGQLSVRAYKGISLLGKTLTFHR